MAVGAIGESGLKAASGVVAIPLGAVAVASGAVGIAANASGYTDVGADSRAGAAGATKARNGARRLLRLAADRHRRIDRRPQACAETRAPKPPPPFPTRRLE